MQKLYKQYLKHLLFNDWYLMHLEGMNHNAMDRSGIYDQFEDDIKCNDFLEKAATAAKKFEKNKLELICLNTEYIEAVMCGESPKLIISETDYDFDNGHSFQNKFDCVQYAEEYADNYLKF